MARFDPIATNFSSGEFSPLLMGRVDIAKYPNGVDTLENFLIMLQGGITRRPGTRYVASTKDNGIARLMPFQYSADQDYVMELSDGYIRMYSNDADLVAITQPDPYTKLLLHCNGTDASTTITDECGKAMTAVGTAQLDTAQKKFETASLLLDGNSDFVTTPAHADFNFGTGNFTIDCWIRFNDKTNNMYIMSQYNDADTYWNIYKDTNANGNKLSLYFKYTGVVKAHYVMTNAWAGCADNTWYHIEVVRNGAVALIFIDGTSQTLTETTAFSTNDVGVVNAKLEIGALNDIQGFFNGWIDEFRISKGIARHTANFTPETEEYSLFLDPVDEIVSPYAEADLFEIQQAHKGDLKYLTHGDYFPRIVSRTSATAFSIDLADIKRGPFLDTNDTTTTITPSADTGAGITLTASAAAFHYDAADGDPDEQLQVGSLWRVKSGVVKILTVVSATSATADVQTEPDGTAGNLGTGPAATTDWAEGAFNGYRGYPTVCAFHDGRLDYACTEYEPQKIWGSVLYDYDNFDADDASDDDAVTFEISTQERVAIRWMASGNKALSIGSTGGTFSAYGTGNAPITPGDIQINRDTNYGSALLPAKRISSFLYYIQRNLHKLRELSYFYDYDITRATDMTMLAEHILREGDGVIDWDYQQSPNDRLWCVRDDGQLAVITRNPEQDVMGWGRIIAGTDSTGKGKFESVCVIPKNEADDQVWVVVNRTIDGTTKRFIEFFTTENFDEEWDAICLDSSLTKDNPKTITGMTNASPGVFTCTAHGFTTGNQVKINGVVLSNVDGEESESVDGIYLLVEGGDADHFTLTTLLGVAINTTEALGYGTYVSGGEVRLMDVNISGAGHLNGETVQVTMDGDVPDTNSFVVTGGALVPDLPSKAAVVHIGLPYTPYMKTLRPEGGSQIGTAQGKIKRIPKITARFYRTLAAQLGPVAKQDRFTFDSLYTGDKDLPVPGEWENDGRLVVTSDKPLPLTLISLQPNINVSDL